MSRTSQPRTQHPSASCAWVHALVILACVLAGGDATGAFERVIVGGCAPEATLRGMDTSERDRLERYSQLAELIAVGEIVAELSFRGPEGGTQRIVSVRVIEVLKGRAESELAYRKRGGTIDGITTASAHEPCLAVGDTCVFFLEADLRGELFSHDYAYLLSRGAAWKGRWVASGASRDEFLGIVREAVRDVEFDRLAARADVVASGVLLEHDAGRFTMRVSELLKGEAQGETMRVVLRFWDRPLLEDGERMLVALRADADGTLNLAGGWQGKYRLLGDGSYLLGPWEPIVPGLPDSFALHPTAMLPVTYDESAVRDWLRLGGCLQDAP